MTVVDVMLALCHVVVAVFYAHPKREAWLVLAEVLNDAVLVVEDMYPLRVWMTYSRVAKTQ